MLGWLAATLPLLAGVFTVSEDVDEVLQFSLAPSSVSAAPGGGWIVAVDQREKPLLRCVRLLKSGEMTPFPTPAMSGAQEGEPLPLDAIEAVKVDGSGIAWLLDNGRRTESGARLIAWEMAKDRLQRVIHIAQPAVVAGSFCTDLVLDPASSFAYVSDPASGRDAALIAINLQTGLARRLLEGHPSVQPAPDVRLGEHTAAGLGTPRIDGSLAVPHTGVQAMAIDRKGEWLYFAALQSLTVYRIHTSVLRDSSANPQKIAASVETYATKPPTRSLAIDSKGNLYTGDLDSRSIGIIDAKDRSHRPLVTDARLLWPDGLTFGDDGKLHFFSATRVSPVTGSGAIVKSGFSLFRTRTPASGRPGD